MVEDSTSKCPVDHSSREIWYEQATKKGPEKDFEQPKCPVDHTARSEWLNKVSVTATTRDTTEAIEVANGCSSDTLDKHVVTSESGVSLPTDRVVSTIPRTSSDSNWIYPSQKQFYDAMKRKNWEPEAEDMKTVVPIHNAVNEMAWQHILNWERSTYDKAMKECGGIKLTSFKGDSKKVTPRAWFNTYIFGYEKPFDRHDWIVDRCGLEVEYVIDFYKGRGDGPSFFLDVRPKLNSIEGIKMRLSRAFGFS